jgi:hypothetical protein
MFRFASRLGLGALALAVALGSAGEAAAQAKKKGRLAAGKVEVESTSNDAWKVTIAVDHPDGTYALNDEVVLSVTSAQDGYLYVYNADSTGAITLIFPNRFQQKNEIRANTPVTIPDPNNKTFRLRADKVGSETFKAIVSTQPLAEVDMAEARSRSTTPVSRNKFIRVAVEAMGGDPNAVTDTQSSTTVPPDGKKPEVVVQKEKAQEQNPVVYKKKEKEWATGQTGITVVEGKPTQDKPKPTQDKPGKPGQDKPIYDTQTQDKPKPILPPEKPTQDKPKPILPPEKPIQVQDKPKPMPPTQDKPKPVIPPEKPIQVQDKPKPPAPPEKPIQVQDKVKPMPPVTPPGKPTQDKPGQDKPKPPATPDKPEQDKPKPPATPDKP